MKKNNFKLILISTILIAGSVNAEFILNVNIDNQKNSIVVDSPFDQFGFDENGIHRSGETTDPEGFNSEGTKPDTNSNVNQSLNQILDSAYNVTLTQDVVEGNFSSLSGTLTFSTTPISVLSVEGNTVVLDEEITTNPFPSNIDIIVNGSQTNNTTAAVPWSNTVEVYQNVQVGYFPPDFLIRHHSTGGTAYCRTDPNIADGTVLVTSIQSTRRRLYLSAGISGNCSDGSYRYLTDLWGADIRYRTESQLVSSTTTDYFILNNVAENDSVDVYLPLRLQASVDGGLYEDVALTRDNVSSNQLTFELTGIDARSVSFRITDLNHSTQLGTLTGLVIEPDMARVE